MSDFICRLEKGYSITYGTDKMCKETKNVMLYGQLQEGLRLSIAVYQVLSYIKSFVWQPNMRRNDWQKSKSGKTMRRTRRIPNIGRIDKLASPVSVELVMKTTAKLEARTPEGATFAMS